MKDKLKSTEVEKLKSTGVEKLKSSKPFNSSTLQPFNPPTLQPFNQTEKVYKALKRLVWQMENYAEWDHSKDNPCEKALQAAKEIVSREECFETKTIDDYFRIMSEEDEKPCTSSK